jgi:hypothetical protein
MVDRSGVELYSRYRARQLGPVGYKRRVATSQPRPVIRRCGEGKGRVSEKARREASAVVLVSIRLRIPPCILVPIFLLL